jgi:hypothetical protein
MDTAARLWHAPLPMEGPADRIALSIEVASGMKLAEGSVYQNLSAAEWLDGKRRLDVPGPLAPPDPSVVAPRGSNVMDVPDPGDLSLSPAAMPDEDSAPLEGEAIPGGHGDRVVATNRDAHGGSPQVARKSANGGTKWVTPLDGHISQVRPPYIVADAERVYVTHYDMHKSGVTALDARTGRVLWHSLGPDDRLLLSGDLLLSADCSGVDGKGGGRFLMARRAATGKEVFRVVLPATTGFNILPIEEAAGWFVVQDHDAPDGAGACLLIDRAGRVRHRLDRQAVAVTAVGNDRLVLTSHDVIRLGADGPSRWAVPFVRYEWIAGGGLIPLAGGDMVAYLYGQTSDSGVHVLRLDPASGRKQWEVWCPSLRVGHSEYSHHAVVEMGAGRLKVTSRGSLGTFVEALDPQTGRSIGRRVIKRCQ